MEFFFARFGVFERLIASEMFLVLLRERREYFLNPTAFFELYGLELLVGIWRNCVKGRHKRGVLSLLTTSLSCG